MSDDPFAPLREAMLAEIAAEAAFVGDQKWITWFTRLISPLTRAEEKHFPAGQIQAALDWASV